MSKSNNDIRFLYEPTFSWKKYFTTKKCWKKGGKIFWKYYFLQTPRNQLNITQNKARLNDCVKPIRDYYKYLHHPYEVLFNKKEKPQRDLSEIKYFVKLF